MMGVKKLQFKFNIIQKLILVFLFPSLSLFSNYFLISEIKANNLYEELNEKNKTSYQEEYILGPGDVLTIGFLEAFEFSGQYSIGPDGLIYLPEIGPLKAADLTITELNEKLKQEFDTYLINPSFTIYLKSYRTVKTLVIGEVVRPGFYNLGGLSRPNNGPIRKNSETDQKELLNIVNLVEPQKIFSLLCTMR